MGGYTDSCKMVAYSSIDNITKGGQICWTIREQTISRTRNTAGEEQLGKRLTVTETSIKALQIQHNICTRVLTHARTCLGSVVLND